VTPCAPKSKPRISPLQTSKAGGQIVSKEVLPYVEERQSHPAIRKSSSTKEPLSSQKRPQAAHSPRRLNTRKLQEMLGFRLARREKTKQEKQKYQYCCRGKYELASRDRSNLYVRRPDRCRDFLTRDSMYANPRSGAFKHSYETREKSCRRSGEHTGSAGCF